MAYKLNFVALVKPDIKTQTKKGNCMDFLKAILGDELYSQLESKVNEHNGNEANKENQVKIGNLGKGEYVSKAKHDALQELLNGKETELASANTLIADLKKSTKGNEDLQGKITGYETQVANLQAELEATKIKSALKVALLSEKAIDIDYLTFKVEEKLKAEGRKLELDDNENIKGWDDLLSDLKTQVPNQFETIIDRKIEPNRLPKPEDRTSYTKDDLLRKPYAERQKIYNENPEAYKEIMKS